MNLTMSSTRSVRQAIRQMQKLELTLELRLLLAQFLQLIEQLIAGRFDDGLFTRIREHLAEKDPSEQADLAYEMVRKSSVEHIHTFLSVLGVLADKSHDGTLRSFLDILRDTRFERALPSRRVNNGLTLGMRLILKEPDWFGGREGTPDNLAEMLRAVPQFDAQLERMVWVLAGGWAVELWTGVSRPHHDIDVVVMSSRPLFMDCDVVHTADYFGVISTSRRFLMDRCVPLIAVTWRHAEQAYAVYVLGPEYLFCSKFLHRPRPQDWEDVCALVCRFAGSFDLALVRDIARRNTCDFTRTRELLRILRTRNPERIIEELRAFYPDLA